ncbi:MAG: hypothetical protein KGY69_18630, partial [Bacteroidales bacterium]|nr:hypothetical protein [Bacteroidales bacterium]
IGYQASNYKHQITNNTQYQNFNDQKQIIWGLEFKLLEFICYPSKSGQVLMFVVCNLDCFTGSIYKT